MGWNPQNTNRDELICRTCGHSFDEHNSTADLLYNPREMVEALRAIDRLIDFNIHPTPETMKKVIRELDNALALCQRKHCTCREFVPST